ncbi:hypothetical protein D3C73_1582050 [compost metagenome]
MHASRFSRLDHRIRFGGCSRHRLLDQHMRTYLSRSDRDLRVNGIRRADTDRIRLNFFQQRTIVRIHLAAVLIGELLRALLVKIAECN